MKVLVIVLPNGFIASAFVASLCHNDNGLVSMPGLNDYLRNLLAGMHLPSGLLPATYGDGIFAMLETMTSRTRSAMEESDIRINTRMAGS